jgi:kinesin family protein 6/9
LADKQRSLDYFKQYYAPLKAINENKRLLKEKYSLAKQTGERVNASRGEINQLKAEIEQIRAQNALQNLDKDVNEESKSHSSYEVTEEESEHLREIERQKNVYKSNFTALKELKKEIERIQSWLGNSRLKMQKDFENWYSVMLRQGFTDEPASAATAAVDTSSLRSQPQSASLKFTDRSHSQQNIENTKKLLQQPTSQDTRVEEDSGERVSPSILPSKSRPGQQNESSGAIPLTGCQQADDDIRAFYAAKEQLLRRTQHK